MRRVEAVRRRRERAERMQIADLAERLEGIEYLLAERRAQRYDQDPIRAAARARQIAAGARFGDLT